MCDICGRSSCANWMHSLDEQERYSKVIEAFDRARQLRDEMKDDEPEEEIDAAGEEGR